MEHVRHLFKLANTLKDNWMESKPLYTKTAYTGPLEAWAPLAEEFADDWLEVDDADVWLADSELLVDCADSREGGWGAKNVDMIFI